MQTFATEAFEGLIGGLIWLGLLHSLWLGLVAAAIVALVFQTRVALSHRSRYTTLLAALSVVAFGPPVLTAVEYFTAGRHSDRVSVSAATTAVIVPGVSTGRSRGAPPPAAAPSTGGFPQTARLLRILLGFAIDRMVDFARVSRPYVLTAWALVVLGLSAVLAIGVKALNQLCRESSPAPRTVEERARKLGRLLRLRIIPAIRVHQTLDEPCLCGLFRPVILLPERWIATAGPESLEAVLAHELAHARRSDHLVNLAQRILESVLFYHPGVHWLSRSLRYQRELCADALAVRLTGDPMALARALESVARLRVGPPPSRLVGAAFGGESSSLLPRIQELIGMTPIRPRAQIWPFAALPSAVAVALVAVSVGLADDEPSPSRPLLAPPAARPNTDTRPVQAIPSPKHEVDRQISYEVRFIELEPDTWRDPLKGEFRALEQQAEMTGWVFDQTALVALLKHIQGEATANHLQAPKVTNYENAHAFIQVGPDWNRSSPGNSTRISENRAGDPEKEAGLRVDVRGSHLTQGTRLTVELGELTLSPGHSGSASVPEAALSHKPEVYSKGTCDVAEGSSLVVSLGRHARGVGPRPATSERLVVITPRRIVLESEEIRRSPTPPKPISRPRGQ